MFKIISSLLFYLFYFVIIYNIEHLGVTTISPLAEICFYNYDLVREYETSKVATRWEGILNRKELQFNNKHGDY